MEDVEEDPSDQSKHKGRILRFLGVDKGLTVYNPTKPFRLPNGEVYIVARVEPPGTEFDSKSMFFSKDGCFDIWHLDESIGPLGFQDPKIAFIHGEIIYSGVQILPTKRGCGGYGYITRIFRGKNIRNLEFFMSSPENMKDIFFKELNNGKLFFATRPEEFYKNNGDSYWRKHVRYSIIDSVDQIKGMDFERHGGEIKKLFRKRQWGAIDDVVESVDGGLGLFVHIGRAVDGKKIYDERTTRLDLESGEITPLKLYVSIHDFPSGPSKKVEGQRDDYLEKVVYCGGVCVDYESPGTVTGWYGLRDYMGGVITKPNPFFNLFSSDEVFI